MASLHEEDDDHNTADERRVWHRGQIFVGTPKGTSH